LVIGRVPTYCTTRQQLYPWDFRPGSVPYSKRSFSKRLEDQPGRPIDRSNSSSIIFLLASMIPDSFGPPRVVEAQHKDYLIPSPEPAEASCDKNQGI
jgi:hypothetical protein